MPARVEHPRPRHTRHDPAYRHHFPSRRAPTRRAAGQWDPDTSLGNLYAYPKFKRLLLKTCNAVGKRNGFKSIDFLKAVVLMVDEWRPESWLVTAAQKSRGRRLQRYDAGNSVRFFLLTHLVVLRRVIIFKHPGFSQLTDNK